MRLGLLGGTFDPIHRAHVTAARAAERCDLDQVLIIPARRPPHKDRGDIADPFHRFAMAALAAAEETRICVSPREVAREGPSYTIDTVRHFLGAGHAVTLVMGTDALAEIDTWREARALLDLAAVIAYPRLPAPGCGMEARPPEWLLPRITRSIDQFRSLALAAGGPRPILCLEADADGVSSTEIRSLLRQGRSVSGLVPPLVEKYITKHRLYRLPEGTGD